ncbi:hypothetical protein V2J09_016140 [Rumex salicifolius]
MMHNVIRDSFQANFGQSSRALDGVMCLQNSLEMFTQLAFVPGNLLIASFRHVMEYTRNHKPGKSV